MATFSRLLEDMVVPIISRLPAKSILRFRCVSKFWFTQINNPSFVTKHLFNSSHNEFTSYTCILFKRTLLKPEKYFITEEEIAEAFKNEGVGNTDVFLSLLYICNNDGDDNDLSYVVEDLHLPSALKINPNYTYITGCCDGMVCLHDYFDETMVLCNPAIREAKLLPRSDLLFDLPYREDNDDALEASTIAMGFGYDAIANEYKVIRGVEYTSETNFTKHPTRIEVYTLGSSAWREIKIDTIFHVSWVPSFSLYLNGYYYWWGSTGQEQQIIISFDMSNELFHLISLPEPSDQTVDINRRLAVWKETIAFISVELDGEVNNSFQMWVMNDFPGYNCDWTKHLRIGPLYSIEFPLVLWKTDELAIVRTDGHVVSCNLESQRLEYLPMKGDGPPRTIQAVNFQESIVSVKGEKGLESKVGSWTSYLFT